MATAAPSLRAIGPMATVEAMRARADAADPFSVGVEEEFFLVDADGAHLADEAAAIGRRAGDDPRFRLELPPCQIEMATIPRSSVRTIEADLRAARAVVARWCEGVARPVSAAVHPTDPTFASPSTRRGVDLVRRFGWLARRQVLGSLQVHVALGSAQHLIAVHDELRAYLPHIAALAAAAPCDQGQDLGMASIRPMITTALPRQGTPPVLGSWERYTDELRWGAESCGLEDPTQWWWELRPHPVHGTLEIRVADAQPTVDDAIAVVELAVAVVRWLAGRADAGELPPPVASWRIDENRWSAALHGVAGTFADPRTGHRQDTTEALAALIGEVEPGAERNLDGVRRLIGDPPGDRIRAWGIESAVDQLAAVFAASDAGSDGHESGDLAASATPAAMS